MGSVVQRRMQGMHAPAGCSTGGCALLEAGRGLAGSEACARRLGACRRGARSAATPRSMTPRRTWQRTAAWGAVVGLFDISCGIIIFSGPAGCIDAGVGRVSAQQDCSELFERGRSERCAPPSCLKYAWKCAVRVRTEVSAKTGVDQRVAQSLHGAACCFTAFSAATKMWRQNRPGAQQAQLLLWG